MATGTSERAPLLPPAASRVDVSVPPYTPIPANSELEEKIIQLALPLLRAQISEAEYRNIKTIRYSTAGVLIDFHSGPSRVFTYQDLRIHEQVESLIFHPVLTQAREGFAAIVARHSSPKVDFCADKVIPASDTLAVYRNGFKLAITVMALLMAVLTVAGLANPVTLLLIAIGISVVSLAILAVLVKTGKISKTDACRLAFMTIAGTFATFFGGATAHSVLLGIYALAVIIQGVLFTGPQGIMAWGKGGYDKYQIAKEVGDKKHMVSAAFTTNSGVWSAAEGTTWIFMGFLLLTAALHGFIPGIPEVLPELLPYVVAILFFGIFNLSYITMIVQGFRDVGIQQKFHKKMIDAFGTGPDHSRAQCIAALQALRSKLIGKKDKTVALLTDPASLNVRLMKKAHRLRKVMDGDAFELVQIQHIDELLARLKNEKDTEALEVSQLYVRDVISANERNITLSTAQIKIGFAGLVIGTILSLIEEFTNSGSVIGMPYIGDMTSLPQIVLDAISTASTVADCSLWAYINHCYKKYLDAPDGRTAEETAALQRVQRYLAYVPAKKTIDCLVATVRFELTPRPGILAISLRALQSIGSLVGYPKMVTPAQKLQLMKNDCARAIRELRGRVPFVEFSAKLDTLAPTLADADTMEKLQAHLQAFSQELQAWGHPVAS
jgi:hypothetical protein